ncbi:MAG: hypothetical protein IJW29_09350 [Clostridia bacterium]|nr:hypothetical protein [Clostridia bacterium]MBQ9785696.1 hypothetical protein [Clostridia bacterium]
MSELEKLQRAQYQKKRNGRILLQKIILVVLTLALLVSAVAFFKLNKDTYVYYTEKGNAIHKAYLNENEFYEEGYLNGSHAYVSSLVEKMTADFSYELTFDTDRVEFKYNYRIDAQLEILDRESGAPLYNPTYEILPKTTASAKGNKLVIEELVEINFQKYNDQAKAYLREFNLDDTTSTLVVRMYVNVVGASEAFAADRAGEYVTELRIPLTKTTFKPVVTTTVPAGEEKILAINENVKGLFAILALALLVADGLMIAFFAHYVVSTRDMHIDYARRVNRLLKSYKSYIQRLTNDFDLEGYRVLRLNEFSEMLEVRDTLQRPILMSENEDRTCARFFIIEDSILYLYEITVEGDFGTAAEAPETESDTAGAVSEAVAAEIVSALASRRDQARTLKVTFKNREGDAGEASDPKTVILRVTNKKKK